MRCALVEGSAVKSRIFRCATQRDRRSADIVNDIISLIQTAEKETGKKGLPVGMGVPTSITNGCLDTCENLPTMPNYPLAKELSQRLGRTVVLENDASCFVLGEYALFDDGVKKTLLGFTLGTSIGMGIIINGKLFKGARGQAGEIWRSPISIAGDESDASVEKDQIVDRCLGGRFLGSLYKKFSGTEISGAQTRKSGAKRACRLAVFCSIRPSPRCVFVSGRQYVRSACDSFRRFGFIGLRVFCTGVFQLFRFKRNSNI